MSKLLPLEDAQDRMMSLIRPLRKEILPCREAIGRYLRNDLIARRDQPPADLSAVDGFAANGPGPWRVIGESRCGHPFNGPVGAGEAVHISTGALLPDDADQIILRETAMLEGNVLYSDGEPPIAGKHIRNAAFDFACGDILLEQGAAMGSAQIALALSAGYNTLQVHRKPRIAIIDSGDELVSEPDNCETHQLPASNSAMLAALATTEPAETTMIGPVPDRMDALLEAFAEAKDADLIVTSGGASVGDHDLVRPALSNWGAELDFWRVAIKPGKPLMVATRNQQTILGLPGNPAACFVTAFLFMLPAIRALSGAKTTLPTAIYQSSSTELAANGPRRAFLRANVNHLGVTPIDETDSSALASLAQANALIVRPEFADKAKKGTNVPIFLLRNGGMA